MGGGLRIAATPADGSRSPGMVHWRPIGVYPVATLVAEASPLFQKVLWMCTVDGRVLTALLGSVRPLSICVSPLGSNAMRVRGRCGPVDTSRPFPNSILEAVAHAGLGEEVPRAGGIVLELLTQL